LKFRGVIAAAILHHKEPVFGCVSLRALGRAIVEGSRHQYACRFLGDHRADAGARGDVERQIAASAAPAHDDAPSVDKRQFAEILDHGEAVLHGIGGLEIDVTAPIGWRDKSVARGQKSRAGGEIARGAFEACERHRSNAAMKPDYDREGAIARRLPQHRESAMAVSRDRRDCLQRTGLL
jgi:hypothetical protein